MINVGGSIPPVAVTSIYNNETQNISAAELFADKKVVLFALPGVFTPTCSQSHLPGYITHYQEIRDKGVDIIACLSVNDSFVMKAWANDQNAENITMIADGNAQLTKAFGLEMDTGDFGGTRSKRYAMIINNGVITQLQLEEPKELNVSSAEHLLTLL